MFKIFQMIIQILRNKILGVKFQLEVSRMVKKNIKAPPRLCALWKMIHFLELSGVQLNKFHSKFTPSELLQRHDSMLQRNVLD